MDKFEGLQIWEQGSKGEERHKDHNQISGMCTWVEGDAIF